jgi:Lar family restriction alleviation protein
MTISDELKPCPFCGKQEALIIRDEGFNKGWKQVFCDYEGVTGPSGKCEHEAIELWNTRPIEDKLAAELLALREAKQVALSEAVKILWLDDSSDYGTALWSIVASLGGDEAADLLESDGDAAYKKYVEPEAHDD